MEHQELVKCVVQIGAGLYAIFSAASAKQSALLMKLI